MIRLEQVSRSFDGGQTRGVEAIDLHVPERCLTVLLGESGCGKTTTLKMINRLIEPEHGRILLDGDDIRGHDPVALRRRIGYVFQGIGLFPHLTVADNIAVVPQLCGWPAAEITARVTELLQLVDLPPEIYAQRYPGTLSGGQQQRVGVARALAARPSLLLMDEPFGALDPLTRIQLQDELLRLKELLGLTIVMVTHDMTEAILLADRLAVMREGRIVGEGATADLVAAPGDEYVAQLLAMPARQAERVRRIVGRAVGTAADPGAQQ